MILEKYILLHYYIHMYGPKTKLCERNNTKFDRLKDDEDNFRPPGGN